MAGDLGQPELPCLEYIVDYDNGLLCIFNNSHSDALFQFKYAKISSHINNSVKKGVIFATYSSLIGESQAKGKYRTRLKQILHWAGKDFDGPVSFYFINIFALIFSVWFIDYSD